MQRFISFEDLTLWGPKDKNKINSTWGVNFWEAFTMFTFHDDHKKLDLKR